MVREHCRMLNYVFLSVIRRSVQVGFKRALTMVLFICILANQAIPMAGIGRGIQRSPPENFSLRSVVLPQMPRMVDIPKPVPTGFSGVPIGRSTFINSPSERSPRYVGASFSGIQSSSMLSGMQPGQQPGQCRNANQVSFELVGIGRGQGLPLHLKGD